MNRRLLVCMAALAAAFVFANGATVDAGNKCCKPAKCKKVKHRSCCAPAPTCCNAAPAPTCCAPAPAPTCCNAAPATCCGATTGCATGGCATGGCGVTAAPSAPTTTTAPAPTTTDAPPPPAESAPTPAK